MQWNCENSANTILGNFLVAWHPKASEENERTTIVIENNTFGSILYRQVAGALARRIVNYAEEGMQVVQGTDAGFIKFGSRVDLFYLSELNQRCA
jgi:phosphatidylserine decarboxylase